MCNFNSMFFFIAFLPRLREKYHLDTTSHVSKRHIKIPSLWKLGKCTLHLLKQTQIDLGTELLFSDEY